MNEESIKIPKIVAVQPLQLSLAQKARLEKLGDVTYYDTRTKSLDEWLERTQGHDIICTGVYGIKDKWNELHDVFVSLPFVGVGWADPAVLKAHNVTISNSPGCNRHAVAEWIIGMLLMMARQLDHYLRIPELPFNQMPPAGFGLPGKNIAVIGKGNIGTQVGKIAESLGMNVTFYQRGDNLAEKVKGAHVVVDALGVRPDNSGLLGKQFFDSLQEGAYFITVSAGNILDVDAMFEALDSGTLAFAASDAQMAGDTTDAQYQKLLMHPKVYVTPHIAYNTDVTDRIGNDMMIDNVEAWLAGKPQNVIG
jgi:phosphoglycerate dehydrogenase-like enzyme